jgi:hypothetical protein
MSDDRKSSGNPGRIIDSGVAEDDQQTSLRKQPFFRFGIFSTEIN